MNIKKLNTLASQFYSERNALNRRFNADISELLGGTSREHVQVLFNYAMENKDPKAVEAFVEITNILSWNRYLLDNWNALLVETWHTKPEDIIHTIQGIANPKSVPFIKKAMQQRYPFLVSYGTGTRQFINQCGHALWSINTPEALAVVEEFTQHEDPIIKNEMNYRWARINGTSYERDFDLEEE